MKFAAKIMMAVLMVCAVCGLAAAQAKSAYIPEPNIFSLKDVKETLDRAEVASVINQLEKLNEKQIEAWINPIPDKYSYCFEMCPTSHRAVTILKETDNYYLLLLMICEAEYDPSTGTVPEIHIGAVTNHQFIVSVDRQGRYISSLAVDYYRSLSNWDVEFEPDRNIYRFTNAANSFFEGDRIRVVHVSSVSDSLHKDFWYVWDEAIYSVNKDGHIVETVPRRKMENDMPLKLGRNEEVTGAQSANITLREAEITITLYRDYYKVDRTLTFFNSGPREKAQLGFPVQFAQRDIHGRGIYDFRYYVNEERSSGTEIYKTKTDTINNNGENTYTDWFIRNVTFPANSRMASRTTYDASYSEGPGIFANAGYIYGTGRFWNGAIEKMTVIINHSDDVLIEDINFGNINASEFEWEANGRYRYVFENVKPQTASDGAIILTVFPSDIYGKYEGQFGLTSGNRRVRTLGRTDIDIGWIFENDSVSWVWDKFLLYKNPTNIRRYTKNQIRLFINFFFAVHGYNFQNPLYREYFSKIEGFGNRNNTRYTVDPNFSQRNFNEIERKNIDYLLNLEKMIPQ